MSKKKYSTELKLEVVQRYLQGNIGLKVLAKEYYVWPGDIQKWRDAYLAHGVEGLTTTHGTYTGDFKVTVVEYMHTTGASLRKTAAHFNIHQESRYLNGNVSILKKEKRLCMKNEEAGQVKWV